MFIMKYLKSFLLVFFLLQGCLFASDSKKESLSQFDFNGQTLIDLGIKLDKPFLKLIGKIVSRDENQMTKDRLLTNDVVAEICRLHPCSEWSEWSKCDANHLGDFGGQTRSRNCGLNTTLCKHYSKPTVVHDTRVCEDQCPKDYTSSGHGFCLKMYDNEKLARDDAEKVCQADGGHLVKVDSDTKVKYVNETILNRAYKGINIWIDGRRSKSSDAFTYGYKSTHPSFTFWGDDDPDNAASDLCITYYKGSNTDYLWRWFDTYCGNINAFICEIQ